MKTFLSNTSVLIIFDEDKELILQRDALESGQRASVIQEEHLTMYASRFLKETKCRFCAQIEMDLVAVVFGL